MTDKELLATLDAKLEIVRDRVRGVAEGYNPGMILWGEGGAGKSYTVETTLQAPGKPYGLTNSRLTAKGLFELLRDQPDIVHVLDDCEPLVQEKHAQGVLRSALWGQVDAYGRQQRVVSWVISGVREEVLVTGGIILVGNLPPDNTPQLRAVGTRVTLVRYSPTNEEIAAQMRHLAAKGHQHGPHFLPPEDCQVVVRALLERSKRLDRNLDLRLCVNAWTDFLQWQNGDAESDWLDLLESRLQQRTVASPGRLSRDQRRQNELAVLKRIANLPRLERLSAWKKATGKSQAALYRRMGELNAETTAEFLTSA